MPRVSKRSALFLLATVASCGRGQFDELGFSELDGSRPQQDSAQGTDVFLNDGAVVQCRQALDCFTEIGAPNTCMGPCETPDWQCNGGVCVPICTGGTCDGGLGNSDAEITNDASAFCMTPSDCFGMPGTCPSPPGKWDCMQGMCIELCPGGCNTDCDCAPPSGCEMGQCVSVSRNNQCCNNPMCPPGSTCIEPNGQMSMCGSNPCMTDCDCPPNLGCAMGTCRGVFRNNECCTNPMCPPGATCIEPNGQMSICGPPPAPCQNDCDCPSTLACAGGSCMVLNRANMCCSNPFCPPGNTCVNPNGSMMTCPSTDGGVIGHPDAGPPPTMVGAPCASDVSCGGPPAFCITEQMNGFPGGYCSQDCSARGAPCPPNATCHDVGMGNSICLEDCATMANCRAGYECVQLGVDPGKTCWPTPTMSMNPMGAPVGSACMVDQDCITGTTCVQFMGFPGGYCSKEYCDPMNPCPAGSQCYAFPGLFSMCFSECPVAGTRMGCRTGYYCAGPTGAAGVCSPG
jgi:hypothetical protein